MTAYANASIVFRNNACIFPESGVTMQASNRECACMAGDEDGDKDKSKVPGGLARAKALTPERKRQIAAKAAAARWGKLPRATHRGNFREDFGIDVDCYVLDDDQKTAV